MKVTFQGVGGDKVSCGDARSNVECSSCRFRVSCSESDERRIHVGKLLSKCPDCACNHPIEGNVKHCSDCGALMKHGIVPKEGNVKYS